MYTNNIFANFTKKLIFTSIIMIGISSSNTFAEELNNTIPSTIRPPVNYIPVEAVEKENVNIDEDTSNTGTTSWIQSLISKVNATDNIVDKNKVLLIQDYLPWYSDANTEELNFLGIPYDSINSNSLPNIDLNNYKAIIITSDQPAGFYEIIRQNKANWDKFVENGGLLVSHSGDHGWQNGDSNGVLPGGILKTIYYSQPLWMRDLGHPVIASQVPYNYNIGWQNPWYFNNWNYSTHGYFTNLNIPYTDVMDINSPTLPSYIDYKFGKGRVLATMQTLEYGYKYLGKQEILRNEFLIIKNYAKPSLATNTPIYPISNPITNGYIVGDSNVGKISNPTYTPDIGDPVNIANGDFGYNNTLLSIKGIGLDYNFKIKYSNQVSYEGSLGHNWSNNYNQMIYSGNSGSLIYLDENFSPREFVKISDTEYKNESLRATLTKENSLYKITFDNGNKYSFNEFNKIAKIEDKNLNSLTFEYDSEKKLSKTIDTLGREINYVYNIDSRLEKIVDFNSKEVNFSYNENNDLISIKIGKQSNFKEIKFEYISGNSNEKLNHNITKLFDSKNQIYVENIYDENDRVTSQKYGNGTIKYSYTVDPITNKVIKNNVENRNGVKTEYSFDNKGNTISRKVETSNPHPNPLPEGEGKSFVEFKFEYDENGRIIKDIKPNGNSIEYSYDNKGRLLFQKDIGEISRTTSYEYNSIFDTPTKIIKPNGLIIENTLDDKGNIIKSVGDSLGEKLETIFEYNNIGQLIKSINSRGLQTSLEYTDGNITKIIKKDSSLLSVLSSGLETSFEYDTNGNVIKTTDSNGNTRNVTYNEFNHIIKNISPEGVTSSFEYDLNGNKIKQSLKLEDGSNLESSTTYDILDHIAEVNSPVSKDLTAKIKYEYDANENVSKIIYPNGSIKELKYNEFDKVVETKQEGIITKYDYDNNGNIVKIIDALGNYKTIEYNSFDEAVKIIDEAGTYTQFSYDNAGNVVEMKVYNKDNKLLSKQEKEYDMLGNIVKQLNYNLTNNQVLTISYKFDKGLLVEKTDSKGNKTNLNYDIYGNNTETIDSLGNKQVLSYDNNGNVISKKVVQSNSKTDETTYSYDKDNRLTLSSVIVSNSEVIQTSYKYNNLNQIIEKKDGNGNITKYEYNYIGKVIKKVETVNSKDISTSYEYDINSNITAVIDGNGNKTSYVYNNLNRLIKEIYTDNKEVSYEYDSLGNVIKKTDPNGNIISNTFDSLNRLIERNITLGNKVEGVTKENYSYDEFGRLVSASDNKGSNLVFSYDSFGNLVSETNNNKEVKYSYDELGNLLNTIYPSSRNISRTYDSIGRLTTIKNGSDVVKLYIYDGLEQTGEINSNNTKTNYSYDTLGRLKELTNIGNEEVKKGKNTSIQESIINKYTFNYDNNSNILSNGQDNYTYDEISRLTNTKTSNPIFKQDDKNNSQISTLYNYDNVGNRDFVEQTTTWDTKKGKEKEKVRIADYTSNNLNQYTSVSTPSVIPAKAGIYKNNRESLFIYDNNGNLVDDGKQVYIYDYRNRLVKVNDLKNKIIAEFSYDILGRRSEKVIYEDEKKEKQITKYIYAGNNAIIEENYEMEDNKLKLEETRENIYSNNIDDILASIVKKGKEYKTYYYTKNQLGSITSITDEKGKVVEEYKYDVFGKTYTRDGKSDNWREFKESKIGNKRLFTGREYDKKIELYYYRARYYSTELGRFISRDPIGQVDDINLYSYVGNNPVIFVDSFGLEKSLINVIYKPTITGGHMSIEIDNYVYTYVASGENRYLMGIGSIILPSTSKYSINAEIFKEMSEDFYDFYKKSDLTIHSYYISKDQKTNIQNYIDNRSSRNNKYNLLGSNCSTFVQSCLYIGGIEGGINDTSLLDGIPAIYNATLLNNH